MDLHGIGVALTRVVNVKHIGFTQVMNVKVKALMLRKSEETKVIPNQKLTTSQQKRSQLQAKQAKIPNH